MNALHLEARLRNGRIASVHTQINKLDIAGRLAGSSVARVAHILPLLYGVCTKAQGAAATAALAAAAGVPPLPAISRDVLEEAVRELLLSVFAGPAQTFLRDNARKIANRAELLAAIERVLGICAPEWLQQESLQRWSDEAGSLLAEEFRRRAAQPEPISCSNLLPVIDAAASLDMVPEWQGRPAETGSISREWHHPLSRSLSARPLLHRWVARLIELLRYGTSDTHSVLGRVCAMSVATGHGRATVETARGLLIHDVLTAHGKVVSYRLLAPTDWNFHPRGTAPGWLEGLPAASPAVATDWMRRVCEALDPCMECHLAVQNID